MIQVLTKRLAILVSFGAVLVSFSEFWFYELDADIGHIEILITYGALGYLFLIVLQRNAVRSLAAISVAAGLLGFLIEGVVVPVLYTAPPFSIVWTSLAWHALLTVGVGWILFKRVMTYSHWSKALALNAVIGIFLGAWNSYMWNVADENGGAETIFAWRSNDQFAEQFIFGYIIFIVGHFVFERAYRRGIAFSQFEHFGLWVIAGTSALLVAATSETWFFFPLLPALCALCLWALGKGTARNAEGHVAFVTELNRELVPLWRYGLTPLLPISAIASYSMLVHAQVGIEMNAILIVIAGPLSVWLFLRGFLKLIWK